MFFYFLCKEKDYVSVQMVDIYTKLNLHFSVR